MQQISFNGLDSSVEANPIYFGVKLTKGAGSSLKKSLMSEEEHERSQFFCLWGSNMNEDQSYKFFMLRIRTNFTVLVVF